MDATMENKMGLPPPYESDRFQQPPPPPAYSAAPPAAPSAPPAGPPPRPAAPAVPTVVLAPQKLGPGPTGLPCPHCRASIVTAVEYTPNNRTHIVAAILCAIAGCCCMCCVPYCMRSCKTANHYCPSCKAFIGAFTPS